MKWEEGDWKRRVWVGEDYPRYKGRAKAKFGETCVLVKELKKGQIG